MNDTRLSIVAWVVPIAVAVFLPLFVRVSEVRSFSASGHELSTEWQVTTMLGFVEGLRFVQHAWDRDVILLTAALALLNLGLLVVYGYLGSRVLLRLATTVRPTRD